MLLNTILLIIGFLALIKGADILVDGSSGLAENFKVPKMLIALTIVAFGTSMPEFAVCIKSILAGSGDIALGNIIGGNTLNILLILGCCATIHPLSVKSNTVRKELPIATVITILLSVLLSDNLLKQGKANMLTRVDGIILVIFFGVFIYYLLNMVRNKVTKEDKKEVLPMPKCILFIILGLAGVIIGSNLVVDSSIYIANVIGISERVISLTIVALGTSLPELVTGITSTRKGEYDIVIGNIVGSNIFNILFVVGTTGLITPVVFETGFLIDSMISVAAGILLWICVFKQHKLNRAGGVIMLLGYVAYFIYLIA